MWGGLYLLNTSWGLFRIPDFPAQDNEEQFSFSISKGLTSRTSLAISSHREGRKPNEWKARKGESFPPLDGVAPREVT